MDNVGGVAGRRPSQGIAEQALEQFEGYGKFLNESKGAVVTASLDSVGFPTGLAGVGEEGMNIAAKESSLMFGAEVQPPPKFGMVGQVLSKIGGVVDAAAGIGELAQTFAAERQRTDFASRMNVATLGKSVEVTARISATSIVGAGVCAAVAAATGAAVLPVIAGAAAGIAAGYAVGKVAEGVQAGYRWLVGG